MNVQGVCGALSREDLGTVTSHEHVLLDLTAFYQALPKQKDSVHNLKEKF